MQSATDLNGLLVQLAGQRIWLFPQKVAFWEETQTLFVSDCHFGKIAHFRKSGIGLPSVAGRQSFLRLNHLINALRPNTLVFLGDVFHSELNSDFEVFTDWRKEFEHIDFQVVLGNHDRYSAISLKQNGIKVCSELVLGPFFCTHEPSPEPSTFINFFGHIHPSVHLSMGRQHIQVSCFWLGPTFLCFPSFGTFTGSKAISPEAGDLVFAIAGDTLRRIEGHLI